MDTVFAHRTRPLPPFPMPVIRLGTPPHAVPPAPLQTRRPQLSAAPAACPRFISAQVPSGEGRAGARGGGTPPSTADTRAAPLRRRTVSRALQPQTAGICMYRLQHGLRYSRLHSRFRPNPCQSAKILGHPARHQPPRQPRIGLRLGRIRRGDGRPAIPRFPHRKRQRQLA